MILGLGFELGDLRLQEHEVLSQDPQHPAVGPRHAARQCQLQGRELGAQAPPRELSEFPGIFFAGQELGKNGPAGAAEPIPRR